MKLVKLKRRNERKLTNMRDDQELLCFAKLRSEVGNVFNVNGTEERSSSPRRAARSRRRAQ